MKNALLSIFIVLVLGVQFSATQAQTLEGGSLNSQEHSPSFEAGSQEQAANHSSASDPKAGSTGSDDAGSRVGKRVTITSLPVDASSAVVPVLDSVANPAPAPAATSIYRVGVGDVLDIKLLNSPMRESTLYSVVAGGLLEYPLAGEPIRVQGLTTDEITSILVAKIKIYENPQVAVNVRDYASHNVIVTGLVRDPGTKALRREAVPLFVVLAEAQPRHDAERAIIMRAGSSTQTIDISDTSATSVLIYANDVIRIVAAPQAAPLYFYIGGQITIPGERAFRSGMTLTQTIFASGGVTSNAGSKAKVMRQGTDGRLSTTEYNLKRIETGKDPDPQIEAGDRIEISRAGR